MAVESKIDVLIVHHGLFWPDLRVVTGEPHDSLNLALDVACKLLTNLNDFHGAFRQCLHEGAAIGFRHDPIIQDDNDAAVGFRSDQTADTLS